MLTDAECRNATCPPGKARMRFADSGGLYLEVSPAGSRRWFWKYRKDGKEGRMALGSHPEVSLRAARLARDAAKLQKSGGRDPVQARKVEKLKASNLLLHKAVALLAMLEHVADTTAPDGEPINPIDQGRGGRS